LKKQLFDTIQLKRTLWRGLIIALPIVIIAWIIYGVLHAVNKLGDLILDPFVPEGQIIWGMGILVILFLVYALGRVEIYSDRKNRKLWRNVKTGTVGRIPILGTFFVRTEKHIISLEELSRMTPCKFWLSGTTPHYGFIIREQRIRGADTEVDVYRPSVPTIVPGDLFPVKKRLVIKLGNPSGEILEKLASGGLMGCDEEIPVPWEDETEEEFKERIHLTPLEIAVKQIAEGKYKNYY
jgi:uncharacterized membrane protein